jgi:hypothetical protein
MPFVRAARRVDDGLHTPDLCFFLLGKDGLILLFDRLLGANADIP